MPENSTNTDDGRWHADKRIPIALIITILMQTAGGVWWAATTESRVGVLEKWVEDNKTVSKELTVIRTKQDNITEMLRRIEQRLFNNRGN